MQRLHKGFPYYPISLKPLRLIIQIIILGLFILRLAPVVAQQDTSTAETIDWNMIGTKIAVGYNSGLIEIIDTSTRQTLTTFQFSYVRDARWSPVDANILAVGSIRDQNNLQIVNTSTGQTLASFEAGWDVVSVAWSPDGQKIAAALNPCEDCPNVDQYRIRIWDFNSLQLLNEIFTWTGASQLLIGITLARKSSVLIRTEISIFGMR